MRIIFVPQYPTPNRYQEWWFWKFQREFKDAGFEVKVLGKEYAKNMEIVRGHEADFSPVQTAIDFEAQQIKEYAEMKFTPEDVLFLADLSFPGLFCNVLHHYRPARMYAFCHATSLNKYDIFEHVRAAKWPVEAAHAAMFNKIFVGSNYHARKLLWPNVMVTSLPAPTHLRQCKSETKIFNIVSASRLSKQKVDLELEVEVAHKFGAITRKFTNSAQEYYEFLGQAKVLLITSHEDTFGYQIVDAINNNCIPIARNGLSYPELLQPQYLYKDKDELFSLLESALWGLLDVPKLKCKNQMDNFYKTIIKEMTNE